MAGICYRSSGETDSAAPAALSSLRAARRRRQLGFLGSLRVTSDRVSASTARNNRNRRRNISLIRQQHQQETITVSETNQTNPTPTNQLVVPEAPIQNFRIGDEVVPEQPKFGRISVCGRRREMEDTVSIHPNLSNRDGQPFHFFGVFDGHGCSHVSMRCRDRLHQIVKTELDCSRVLDWPETFRKCFKLMDIDASLWASLVSRNIDLDLSKICRCELQAPRSDAAGSTAVVSLVTPTKIIVSNCGDSRAVLCRNGVAIPLSSDHKPDRPDELQRVNAAGGRVIYWEGARVLGVLAMSRAIGDNYLKPYVISDPEVIVQDRTDEDECLILASDGLWDVVSNETACGVARACLIAQRQQQWTATGFDRACADASALLTKLAIARRSADNISVIVVDLRRNRNI